jgi:tRNA threonylcarbamoyladenosine biosynthesis protein TsaE
MQVINYHISDIEKVALAIWNLGKEYKVWTFNGDMGAGKTTLISAICKQLGVQDAVSSPTYALVNEYQFEQDRKTKKIFHTDWYRLKDVQEVREVGMEEILNQTNSYCFIEWATIAPELLLQPYLKIEIEVINPFDRIIKLST